MRIAVVLQKPATLSKTRLKDYFSYEERIELVYAMFTDVLKQLSEVNSLDYFAVITQDPHVIHVTHNLGGKVFYEKTIEGMNKAVSNIQRYIDKEVKHMLVLPGDIPLICASEIDHIFQDHLTQNREATIIPCSKGTGTNGILLSPPQIMSTSFGEGSFKRHCKMAQELNLHYETYHAQSISYDIDTKEDLLIFDGVDPNTLTSNYIKNMQKFSIS